MKTFEVINNKEVGLDLEMSEKSIYTDPLTLQMA